MALPFNYIPNPNEVVIYGAGLAQSLSGVVPDNTSFKYGSIYAIGANIYNVQVGDYVLFDEREVQVRLLFGAGNYPYTVFQGAQLAGVDQVFL